MTGRRRPAPHAHGLEETRQRISREAARIMAEEGVQDYHAAKRKAADRLNLPETRQLPSNQEIEQALTEHLQLFHARQLPQTLRHLRTLAVKAMQLLERFEPRLVGSLLTGNVTRFSEIQLHVTADTPELVAFFLQDQGIPYEEDSKRLRYGGDRIETVPTYRFLAEDVPIEICVFSPAAAREVPLSPVDGRPMKRATIKDLQVL
jgi:predicted component of type VI protein secretion system